jgi:hypothetical protein
MHAGIVGINYIVLNNSSSKKEMMKCINLKCHTSLVTLCEKPCFQEK